MKFTTITGATALRAALLLGILPVATGAVHAQTKKLAFKKGSTLGYQTLLTMEQKMSMGGSDMSSTIGFNAASSMLSLDDDAAGRLGWKLDLGSVHVTAEGNMLPSGKVDTTMSAPPITLRTDAAGKPDGGLTADGNSPLMALLNGPSKLMLGNWFSPTNWRAAKPGDSWEETIVDTTVNGLVGVQMRTTMKTRYTFGGMVDTLGVKCARIYANVLSIAVAGSGDFNGAPITLDGDGTASGVSYYNGKDGALQASTLDCNSTVRMAVGGGNDMVMPVSVRTTGSVVRAAAQKK